MHLGRDVDDIHTAWLAFLVIVVGSLMLLVVVLSFASLHLLDCKLGVVASGYIALFISITSIVMGITAIVVKGDLYTYLDSEGGDMGLSDDDAETIKHWYNWIIIGLFCSFCLQFIRFKWSTFLYKNFSAQDVRYQSLLALEEDEYVVKLNAGRAERTERYDNLRSHYKNKYATKEDNKQDDLFF